MYLFGLKGWKGDCCLCFWLGMVLRVVVFMYTTLLSGIIVHSLMQMPRLVSVSVPEESSIFLSSLFSVRSLFQQFGFNI